MKIKCYICKKQIEIHPVLMLNRELKICNECKKKIEEARKIEEDTEIWKESKNIVRKIGANK